MRKLKINPFSSKARYWVFNLLLLIIWKASFINAAWLISAPFLLLSGLHPANLSWQTRVGKPNLVCVNSTKQAANTFANCWCQIEACLQTVFMPFTHTNLSLPTRLCQLQFAVWRPLYQSGLISGAHIQISSLQWLWIINDVQAFCPMIDIDDFILHLVLSFCFDWEDISNTWDSVSSTIKTPRIPSIILLSP